MSPRLILGGMILATVAVGCAAGNRPKPAAAEGPRGPVIVRLVGQHQSITVTSGPNGPLYTAQTTDGQTIVANATLAELRVNHPEVYQFIEPSFAADASVAPSATRQKRATHGPIMLDSAR
jgi:hypothetical protein